MIPWSSTVQIGPCVVMSQDRDGEDYKEARDLARVHEEGRDYEENRDREENSDHEDFIHDTKGAY